MSKRPLSEAKIVSYNQQAWDRKVESKNQWTTCVSEVEIQAAREGKVDIVLTPQRKIPKDWLSLVPGKKILCLACGGGQQGPILAAAGANVTVFDLSEKQLGQDRAVAERENLDMSFQQGDMRDLSCFSDQSFDLIFHPVSNCFAPELQPVWNECFRVLRPGGELLSGFCNPVMFIFCLKSMEQGELVVRHSIPHADALALSEDELNQFKEDGEPLEYGHTLEDQIGGQLQAGFLLKGFYEDKNPDYKIDEYLPTFQATRAWRPN